MRFLLPCNRQALCYAAKGAAQDWAKRTGLFFKGGNTTYTYTLMQSPPLLDTMHLKQLTFSFSSYLYCAHFTLQVRWEGVCSLPFCKLILCSVLCRFPSGTVGAQGTFPILLSFPALHGVELVHVTFILKKEASVLRDIQNLTKIIFYCCSCTVAGHYNG